MWSSAIVIVADGRAMIVGRQTCSSTAACRQARPGHGRAAAALLRLGAALRAMRVDLIRPMQ